MVRASLLLRLLQPVHKQPRGLLRQHRPLGQILLLLSLRHSPLKSQKQASK